MDNYFSIEGRKRKCHKLLHPKIGPLKLGCKLGAASHFQQRALNWVLLFIIRAGLQSGMDHGDTCKTGSELNHTLFPHRYLRGEKSKDNT
jgi:hypothetical protein